MKETWVQDVKITEVDRLISEMANRNEKTSPYGSRYVSGPSKSGEPDEEGIYFQDPTAKPRFKTVNFITAVSAGLLALVGLGGGSYLIISGNIVGGVKVIFLGIILGAIVIGFNWFIAWVHERIVSKLLK